MKSLSRAFRWVVLVAVVGVAAGWWREQAIAAELEARWQALRQVEQQQADLQAERDRLREQLQAASAAIPGPTDDQAEPEPGSSEAAVAPAAFAVGEWVGADHWSNQGEATPRETLATALWAAAGGNLAVFKRALVFDDAVRAKAVAWHDSLPPDLRATYPTPEDLVASASLQSIPITAAQLVWLNQTDPDHAIVGVFLEGDEPLDPATAPAAAPEGERPPPMIPAQTTNRLALLNLDRSAEGWRIRVPAEAIDRLQRGLGGKPPFVE